MMNRKRLEQLTKGIIFIIPCIVFVYLALQYMAFFGTFHVTYDFAKESDLITQWNPLGRALDREKNLKTGETYQRIVGEPVYMTVNVPRSFDTVDVTMEYQNDKQSLLEFGIVTSQEPFATKVQPFESLVINQALDGIATGEWHQVSDDAGTTLLQRENNFASVQDFKQHIPTDKRIGTYKYDLVAPYIDPNYAPQADADKEGGVTIDRVLRGPHEFYTYIKDEPLHITVDTVDVNEEANADPVKIEVYSEDLLIHEQTLEDDGVTEASKHASTPRSIDIELPKLNEGVYRIKLVTTPDILTTHIHTAQHKFVVKDKLALANTNLYQNAVPDIHNESSSLFMQNKQLLAFTSHIDGLQTLTIGDQPLVLNTVEAPFFWTPLHADDSVKQVAIPKSDLTLRTTAGGFFAFTKDSFFDPDYAIQPITETTTLDELDYILFSGYTPAEEGIQYSTQHVRLNLEGVAGDRKELTFLLSAPGIDRRSATVQIKHIQFDFHREPLYKRILQKFK